MSNKVARLRRAKKSRMHIRELKKTRLSVHRTPQHIYAQIIAPEADQILVAASTLEKSISGELKSTGNVAAAEMVGEMLAKRAKEKGIEEVAFDRSGFAYHGRVKALAEAARKGGLKF